MSILDATTVPIRAGKTPDLQATPTPAQPLDLPRLVMRRALVVAIVFLQLALVLGLLVARSDTQEEIAGALALEHMDLGLHNLPADDARAIESLRRIGTLRHVQLRVTDADGRLLFETVPPPPAAPLRWFMQADEHAGGGLPAQTVSWPVQRANGGAWTATLTASPESEQREALTNLLGLFALLATCCVLMLAVMRWNVRRAFGPLQAMLGAIARIEHQDLAGVKALPPMPIRELEATSLALKRLAASLEQAEEARRNLAQKILTLQEDERQGLARDLHDEFGQRLTALRADTAWLRKRLADDATMEPVIAGMGEQIARIQRDVRDLLTRLRPLGGQATGTESAARLASLLGALAASWTRPGVDGLRCKAHVGRGTPSASQGAPDAALAELHLPGAVVLALYRISQEALTNAARHGGATQARVDVAIEDDGPDAVVLHWSASDDGTGLAQPESALQRGNGLAGIKERAWAVNGEFDWSATNPPPMSGLALRVTLRCAVTRGESTAVFNGEEVAR